MHRLTRVTAYVVLAMAVTAPLAAQDVRGKLEGRSDFASESITLADGLLMTGVASVGSGAFIATLLGTDGSTAALLGSAFGKHQGVRIHPVKAGTYVINVRASGPWTMLYEQPRPSKGEPLPMDYKSSTNVALGPFQIKRGLLRVAATHAGDGAFIVRLLRVDGATAGLLASAFGKYDGSKAQPIATDGLYYLDVATSGPWSIKMAQ